MKESTRKELDARFALDAEDLAARSLGLPEATVVYLRAMQDAEHRAMEETMEARDAGQPVGAAFVAAEARRCEAAAAAFAEWKKAGFGLPR